MTEFYKYVFIASQFESVFNWRRAARGTRSSELFGVTRFRGYGVVGRRRCRCLPQTAVPVLTTNSGPRRRLRVVRKHELFVHFSTSTLHVDVHAYT